MPSKKDLSLYKIWTKASKELEQITGFYGNARLKQACALGAVAYYNPDRRGIELDQYEWDDMEAKIDKFIQRAHSYITVLNDDKGWTFKKFAQKAKEWKL